MEHRKIGFFFLQLVDNNVHLEIEPIFDRLLRYIISQSKTKRKQDLSNDRIYFIESYS